MDLHEQPVHRKYCTRHHEYPSHWLPDQNTEDATAYFVSDYTGTGIHRNIYSRIQHHRFLHTDHLRYHRPVHEDIEHPDCATHIGGYHRQSDGAELQDGECKLRRFMGDDNGIAYSNTVCCTDGCLRFPAGIIQPSVQG